jgi:hypothetical protein
MPIWRTDPVTEEPEIDLVSWKVIEVRPSGARHFVGFSKAGHEGRISSRIEDFDNERLVGRTKSGRVYRLVGPAGVNRDAEYVFSRWREMNGIGDKEFSILDLTK